jgi:opacity protein-like surface antigen
MKINTTKITLSLLSGLLLMTLSLKTQAQKGEFGIRFMPTFSSFDLRNSSGNTIKGEVTLGYGGGIFLGFNFDEHFGIQSELLYTSISQKHKELEVEQKVTLRYVNIPLLFSLNTGKSKVVNLNAVVGPQLGISAGSNTSYSNNSNGTTTATAVLAVKKSDIGFAYGAGVDFALNEAHNFRLGLGFRGVYGLFDISDNSKSITTDSYYILDRTKVVSYSGYLSLSVLIGKTEKAAPTQPVQE